MVMVIEKLQLTSFELLKKTPGCLKWKAFCKALKGWVMKKEVYLHTINNIIWNNNLWILICKIVFSEVELEDNCTAFEYLQYGSFIVTNVVDLATHNHQIIVAKYGKICLSNCRADFCKHSWQQTQSEDVDICDSQLYEDGTKTNYDFSFRYMLITSVGNLTLINTPTFPCGSLPPHPDYHPQWPPLLQSLSNIKTCICN